MKQVHRKWLLVATGTLLVLAVLFIAWLLRERLQPQLEPAETVRLRSISIDDAGQLLERFRQLDYGWPPNGPVPALALEQMPDRLNELRVQEKKSVFFRTLAPLIAAENAEIRKDRQFLQQVFATENALQDPSILARTRAIAIRYKVAGEPDDLRFQRKLLARVDMVPAALILAQAANESAWGTSRFAQEANNLFGIWTWNEEQGLMPKRRDPDATHFVRIYENLRAAVKNYLYTINIGGAYADLRRMRADMRAANKPLDAIALAGGLSRYSARGQAYVDELRSMIRYNKLDAIGRLELRDSNGNAAP